jgi:opacity protein-like surface antigen
MKKTTLFLSALIALTHSQLGLANDAQTPIMLAHYTQTPVSFTEETPPAFEEESDLADSAPAPLTRTDDVQTPIRLASYTQTPVNIEETGEVPEEDSADPSPAPMSLVADAQPLTPITNYTSTPVDPQAPTGFYVGLQGGYNSMAGKYRSVQIFTGPPTEQANLNKNQRSGGVIGGPVIGYLWNLHPFFAMGIDVEATWDNNKLAARGSLDGQSLENTITRRWTVTPAFLVRVPITHGFFVFGKLGFGVSSFRHTIINQTNGIQFVLNQKRYGVVPTLGVEYCTAQRWALTGSVTYERYGQTTRNVPNTTPVAPFPTPFISKVTLSYVSFKVGVKYYF